MSVCPWFPSRAVDNKSHLQVRIYRLTILIILYHTHLNNAFFLFTSAFVHSFTATHHPIICEQAARHLYALAVEWRWLRCVDVDSGQDVDLPVVVQLVDSAAEPLALKTPSLLPELASIRRVTARSPFYHDAELRFVSGCPIAESSLEQRMKGSAEVSVTPGGGQSLVLFLKRKPALSRNIPRLPAARQIESPGVPNMSPLQRRHEDMAALLREKLSLKIRCTKPPVDSLALSIASSKGVPHNALNDNQILRNATLTYLRLEEDVYLSCSSNASHAESSRRDSNASLHLLRAMSSCDRLFDSVSRITLPLDSLPPLVDGDPDRDAKAGRPLWAQGLKSVLQLDSNKDETLSRPRVAAHKSLSALFLASILQSQEK
jgi:hypothetical protein